MMIHPLKAIPILLLFSCLVGTTFGQTISPTPHKGFLNLTSFGLMFGREEIQLWPEGTTKLVTVGVSLQSFNGFQFHKALAVGMSINLDAYLATGGLHVPMAFGVRGFFGKQARFFYGLDIGPSVMLSNTESFEEYKSFMLQPLIGYKLSKKANKSLFIQTGLKKQRLSLLNSIPDGSWQSQKEITYNRWFISIGCSI